MISRQWETGKLQKEIMGMRGNVMIKLVITLFWLFLSSTGCSISYSVDQSSDSVTKSSDSISASFDSITSISTSSGSEKKDVQAALQRFRDDISGLTRLFLNSDQGGHDFERQLGEIAMHYGVADWEHEPMIFLAIGTGLRDSGITRTQIGTISFLQTPVLQQHHKLIENGFVAESIQGA